MSRFDLRSVPVYPIALSVSLTLNVVQFANRDGSATDPLDSAVATAQPVSDVTAPIEAEPSTAVFPQPATTVDVAEGSAPVAVVTAAQPSAEPAAAELPEGMRVAVATITGPMSTSLAATLGDDADRVSQTAHRLLAWDLDFTRDLQRGDEVRIAFTADADDVVIHAVTYDSQKFGRSFSAYRWQFDGDIAPSYFDADGLEVPRRLDQSPIEQYEQITSLLGDRPGHGGMDFAAPVGAPVSSPWAGRVTRTNWNWSANGNCIEVDHGDGLVAKYLHLNENHVEPGDSVAAGQLIALSGNTGRSTGPHLHYQLERNGVVIDPLDVHDTYRRSLSDVDRIAFSAFAARMNAMLEAPLAH